MVFQPVVESSNNKVTAAKEDEVSTKRANAFSYPSYEYEFEEENEFEE
jgi:hypothetical protein